MRNSDLAYDTVIIDTSVIGHLAYHSWHCQQSMEEFIEEIVAAYNRAFFINKPVGRILWLGDAPPYFRKIYFSSYKSNRPAKPSDQAEFLVKFNEISKCLRLPHFECDDLAACYVDNHPEEKILLLTVDSDWLQLIGDNVDWCCAKGYAPQLRTTTNGNFEKWLRKKLSKVSKKKQEGWDLTDPRTIVEWKVALGDGSDCIPSGEKSRELIDLRNPLEGWKLLDHHPDFLTLCEEAAVTVNHENNKHLIRREFTAKTDSYLPTPTIGQVP